MHRPVMYTFEQFLPFFEQFLKIVTFLDSIFWMIKSRVSRLPS